MLKKGFSFNYILVFSLLLLLGVENWIVACEPTCWTTKTGQTKLEFSIHQPTPFYWPILFFIFQIKN